MNQEDKRLHFLVVIQSCVRVTSVWKSGMQLKWSPRQNTWVLLEIELHITEEDKIWNVYMCNLRLASERKEMATVNRVKSGKIKQLIQTSLKLERFSSWEGGALLHLTLNSFALVQTCVIGLKPVSKRAMSTYVTCALTFLVREWAKQSFNKVLEAVHRISEI